LQLALHQASVTLVPGTAWHETVPAATETVTARRAKKKRAAMIKLKMFLFVQVWRAWAFLLLAFSCICERLYQIQIWWPMANFF
jgi:hypothetical protein